MSAVTLYSLASEVSHSKRWLPGSVATYSDRGMLCPAAGTEPIVSYLPLVGRDVGLCGILALRVSRNESSTNHLVLG